jgi:hypothetical protein
VSRRARFGSGDEVAVELGPVGLGVAELRDSLRDGTIETFMASYVESALPEFDDRIEAHDAERIRFVRSQPDAFAI